MPKMTLATPALLLLLAGCTLPDQRTFMHASPAPGATEAARATLPALPYVVVTLPVPDANWEAPLAQALRTARDRRPDAEFDLLALVPIDTPDTITKPALAQASADARTVAEAVSRQGIPPEWLHLGLQAAQGAQPREVRIFVR